MIFETNQSNSGMPDCNQCIGWAFAAAPGTSYVALLHLKNPVDGISVDWISYGRIDNGCMDVEVEND